MRNIYIIAVICIIHLSTSVNAQYFIGINHSFARYNTLITDVEYEKIYKLVNFFAPQARYSLIEIWAGKELTDNLNIETGLFFNKVKSTSYNNQIPGASGSGFPYGVEQKMFIDMRYVSVPLLCNFHMTDDNGYIYWSIGPQINYLYKATSYIQMKGQYFIDDVESNYDFESKAFGYTYRDKFNSVLLEATTRLGVRFKLEKVAFDLGYAYSRSLQRIEDMDATDNLGRKLNRFTSYSENYEGTLPPTYMSRGYFYVGMSYIIK